MASTTFDVTDRHRAEDALLRTSAFVDAAVADVRGLLVELRPPLLREQGLAAALDNELLRDLDGDADVNLQLLAGDSQTLRLSVRDDGRGIADADRAVRPGHLVLVGMRERAIATGARLEVLRQAEGGAEVRVRWGASAPDSRT